MVREPRLSVRRSDESWPRLRRTTTRRAGLYTMLTRTTCALAALEAEASGWAFRKRHSTPAVSTAVDQPCPALLMVASSTAVVPAQFRSEERRVGEEGGGVWP